MTFTHKWKSDAADASACFRHDAERHGLAQREAVGIQLRRPRTGSELDHARHDIEPQAVKAGVALRCERFLMAGLALVQPGDAERRTALNVEGMKSRVYARGAWRELELRRDNATV